MSRWLSARFVSAVGLGVLLTGCIVPARTPKLVAPEHLGRAPADLNADEACRDWSSATASYKARVHDAYPELDPRGCFTPVYDGNRLHFPAPPEHCVYPQPHTIERIRGRALRYEVAHSSLAASLPLELSCDLPAKVRQAAAQHNAATLRALASHLTRQQTRYPYALVGTFGYGNSSQSYSVLADYRPGQPCHKLAEVDRIALSVNLERAQRAAQAFHAGVAPVVSVSGGAVHAKPYEAFMLLHLLTCEHGVPPDRVLLDPCADHTHTNVRNTGALVIGVGGRFAYLVTDAGLQASYLEEWTAFDLVGGSIDQRALRDFGHLIGAWRRASQASPAGFWFTPFRFWADPRYGALHCVQDQVRTNRHTP